MSLLIDDYPLIVLPALAEEIGLNEAIFLQQLNYWSQPSSIRALSTSKADDGSITPSKRGVRSSGSSRNAP